MIQRNTEKRPSEPNVTLPPTVAKTKDDLTVGDRFKLFMNISPRASQSMLSLNSSQLQALRDKHKAAKATEPMDLRDVMLKMRDPNYGLEMKDAKIGFFTTKRCMTGQQLIDWLIAQKLTESGSRAEAVAIATALLNTGNIELAKAVNDKEKEGIFGDSLSLYTIAKSEDDKKREKAAKDKEAHSPRGTSPRRRWFGSTLPDIMSSQEPGEKVPRVATALLSAVLAMNGARTEGIFRISPEGSLIESLKEQLERGNLTIGGHDPHVPACCFKLFLRELRQPVIPDALYDECIKAAESAAAAEAVVSKLPETNRNLLLTLVSFLVDLAAPENVQVTKMPVSNLAVVFAPCLLRCPLTNPMDIMRNSSVEQMFVQTLIEAHCPPSYVKSAAVAVPRTIAIPLRDNSDSPSALSSSGKSLGTSLTPTSSTSALPSNTTGSGKNLDSEVKRSSGKAQDGVPRTDSAPGRTTRTDTAGSSGSGKKIEAMASSSAASSVASTPTSSGAIPTTPSGDVSPEAAKEASGEKRSEGSGKHVELLVGKSEPVPIPGAVASLSTSGPSHSPASTADPFSAPTSPAPAIDAGTSPAPTESVPAAPVVSSSTSADAAGFEDAEVAEWLKEAEPAVATRLAPQMREAKQRLKSAEAAADAELTSFYMQQLESLRRQVAITTLVL